MSHPMDLSELIEARNGRPTEDAAVRKIAAFAVIPAACIGLLGATQLVGLAEPMGRLAWVCTACACGAGFGTAFLVMGLYRLFGFRPVAVVADALVGVFYGLLCGGALAMGLAALQLVTPGQMLWPLLLIPLGAVAVPLWRVWRSPRDPRAPHGPD